MTFRCYHKLTGTEFSDELCRKEDDCSFMPLQKSKPKCVYWNFSLQNGVGDWSESGCQYVDTKNGVVKCLCFHLSTFAVLQVKVQISLINWFLTCLF